MAQCDSPFPQLFIYRTIDGVTYPGNIKEKEVAKKQYEKAVSQGKTAGLVKYVWILGLDRSKQLGLPL